ncbi:NAD(P)-dependent alcohol dehydrogenase [Hoeflea sp.]|uniref:NAD(P)-dependent alcohol dehydrogenase n=1 Tax=Hoeflea sp. TaxID=1940281 RepID=UPI003B0147D2
MKAVVCRKYGPPEVLSLAELEKPTPGKGQICVRTVATAVTASDCRVRAFRFPMWDPMILMFRLIIGVSRPRKPVLGLVLSGEVESVGRNVTRFKPGDQVYGMTGPSFGAYAEYTCLSQNAAIVKKPDSMSHREAAAVAYGGLLAGYCLEKGAIQRRKKVLIYGASGAIGTSAVQLAKQAGAQVAGVCSTANLELVKSLGADAVIDYTRQDRLNDGERYDLVLDAVGKDKSSKFKDSCRKALTDGGRYLSVDDGMLKSRVEDLHKINALMESGQYKAIIDRAYALDRIVEAHRYVDTGRKRGNVVIDV